MDLRMAIKFEENAVLVASLTVFPRGETELLDYCLFYSSATIHYLPLSSSRFLFAKEQFQQ